ncbi:hypothetical protein BKA70DRAFT_1438987 [Coprinopsis sp. MPI-PUGE-AT-0042]|nr:hypothetical protein BKA70DRAFT_1438987 [Coprinopsis sp. MPI-PUGE-AT-0042]
MKKAHTSTNVPSVAPEVIHRREKTTSSDGSARRPSLPKGWVPLGKDVIVRTHLLPSQKHIAGKSEKVQGSLEKKGGGVKLSDVVFADFTRRRDSSDWDTWRLDIYFKLRLSHGSRSHDPELLDLIGWEQRFAFAEPSVPVDMARTKQTARKSQGAFAPRVPLEVEGVVLGDGRRITRLIVQQGNHVTAVWLGSTDEEVDLCIRCHNGGTLQLCEGCEVSSCTVCVVMKDPNELFWCIKCWKSEEPYPHTIIGTYAVRTSAPRLNLGKVAVISFVLAGSEEFGDPTRAAFDALASYLRGNVILFKVVFDFASKAGVKKSIQLLVDELMTHDHQEYILSLFLWTQLRTPASISRFLVSINSHSDPARGDIHIRPDNKGSAPLGELVAFLLPPQLRTILERGGGPLSEHLFPPQLWIFLANSGLFNKVIAFDQERLQPALAYGFIADACRSYFIYDWPCMTGVLTDHHVFGAHSGLVVFTKDATTKFLWAHPVRQPFGQRISPQCKVCKREDGFTKERTDPGSQTQPNYNKELFLRCKNTKCKAQTLYSIPNGGKWFKNQPPAEDHHGAWLQVPY